MRRRAERRANLIFTSMALLLLVWELLAPLTLLPALELGDKNVFIGTLVIDRKSVV